MQAHKADALRRPVATRPRRSQDTQELRASLLQAELQQTAVSEILKVISSSPSDVQPVFDAIARNATNLCESAYANVFRFDGTMVHWAASYGWPAELMSQLRETFPMRPNRARAAGSVQHAKFAPGHPGCRNVPA